MWGESARSLGASIGSASARSHFIQSCRPPSVGRRLRSFLSFRIRRSIGSKLANTYGLRQSAISLPRDRMGFRALLPSTFRPFILFCLPSSIAITPKKNHGRRQRRRREGARPSVRIHLDARSRPVRCVPRFSPWFPSPSERASEATLSQVRVQERELTDRSLLLLRSLARSFFLDPLPSLSTFWARACLPARLDSTSDGRLGSSSAPSPRSRYG